ncbi:Fis family transcriptional regulator [Mycobacterium sp. AT1]|uniref:Fis family transcriptional regulator n=1 Tax=Mycobacterium sp. AT1 TaxID=1961706 RepID=UPI0009AD4A31|nr:Fis family transcriptional regulator [Mycobacterium sp. AT1]OPX07972.1 Fis family transcriptional regulator [Mycobacterium sp. AT1]
MDTNRPAHLDDDAAALVVEHLTVRDKDVIREAQRWTTGERGPVIDDPQVLATADLREFVCEAMKIGAHALSATGQAQDARVLEQMLKDVGDKAAASTVKAAEATQQTVKDASQAMAKAAADAQKAITEADAATRKQFTESVTSAKTDLQNEVRKVLGGENPELLERLQPVLDKFGVDLDAKAKASVGELLAKAARQFDPSDPTSPMAKHTAELETRQQHLTQRIDENHLQVVQKVDELTMALKLQEARTTIAKVSPIKGDTYENAVNTVLFGLAAGLGDEYTDTRTIVGALTRSKKGDGLLTIDGGTARVVIEMTDSARAGWSEYFGEAERNRQAAASLGLVRTPEQNGGQSIRVLGARRIVLAFDPATDDPELVRTILMVLRTSAVAAASRHGAQQLATAEEKIAEAVVHLDKIDDVKKTAGSIQKNAVKIESACTGIYSGIQRLLSEALAALTDVVTDSSEIQSTDAVA